LPVSRMRRRPPHITSLRKISNIFLSFLQTVGWTARRDGATTSGPNRRTLRQARAELMDTVDFVVENVLGRTGSPGRPSNDDVTRVKPSGVA
jgi:hypothetical protein